MTLFMVQMWTLTLISLITVFLISAAKGEWDLESHRRAPACASLFSNSDYSGSKYELTDGVTLSDTTTIAAWNGTKGLRIKSGCTLTVCDFPAGNSTKGGSEVCHKFIKDTSHLPEEWYSESSAAHCTCTKQCSCESIVIRRKECARAYLENDCNACNSFYANLKQTEGPRKEILSSRLQRMVRAVIVRPGCSLEVRNSTTGGQMTVSGKIVQNWEGDLTEYQCKCDQKVPYKHPKPAANSPQLLDVPKTSGAINSMLTSRWKDHPGLTAALQSVANKRSSKNAYILMLGLTGSGKSTTINFLFDNSNITKVGDKHSVTTNIHEYRISVPVPELGLNNTELRIIDTPGIVDTRGLEQDARYIATLNEYLNKHEDLKRSIPNVVLIFFKFDENRFRGYGSNFAKMLRTIDLFKDRIMDRKFSNVIFVATHYMSESKEIVRRPQQRLAALKKEIQAHTLFPSPTFISLAENKPEEAGLLSVNGFYAFSNGEFYPKNLFDRIQLVTTAGGDPIGEAVIRTAFKSSDFSYGGTGGIQEVVFPLVAPTHSTVIEYLGILSSFNRNPNRTQISQALQSAYDKMAKTEETSDESFLSSIQRIFYLNRISTVNDLPTRREEIFKFFKQVPRNPDAIGLIQTAFNLSIPEYEPSFLIGFGYNLMGDTSLPSSPLELPSQNEDDGGTDQIVTDIGFKMHKLYKSELRTSVNTIFQTFTSREEYTRDRLESILHTHEIPEELVTSASQFGTKPGWNVIDVENLKLSAAIEYQTFALALDPELIQLNEDFSNEVLNLPQFNRTEWEAVKNWKHFFAKYGTHVVDSAYGGGYIEITVKQAQEANVTDLFAIHEQLTDGVGKIVDYIAGVMIGKETLLDTSGIEYTLHYGGGNHKYYVASLSDTNAKTKLLSWKESLAYEPIILSKTSPFTLLPIADLVEKHLGAGEAFKVRDAVAELFNGSLSYSRAPASSADVLAPADRSQTEAVTSTGDFVALKEFAHLLHKMADEARERNEKLITLIMENRQESERIAGLEDERRRATFAETMKSQQNEYDEAQQGNIETAAERAAREAREDQLRQEKFEQDRLQFLQSSEAAAQRHQQFIMFIIESNRAAEEARRKNSILNKFTDAILPAVGGAAVGMLTALG